MSYAGKNPTFRAITLTGFADFVTADATTKKEGRLVWVQDEDAFYQDNGTILTEIGAGIVLFGKSIQEPIRLDMKQDTFSNLTTYALTATDGQLCFATDTKKAYQVIDNLLVDVGGGAITFWQRELLADLNIDGTIADLAITGLTVGQKYEVTLNVRAARRATSYNEVQELSFSATPTYGLFQIDFDNQTTYPLPYDATDVEIQAAMDSLSNIAPSDVVVTGGFPLFTFTFGNTYANINVPQITVPTNSLETGENNTPALNEQQDLTFSASPTSGTFTITFSDPYWDIIYFGPQTTAPIQWDASVGDVKTALELLDGINGVTVTAI